MGDKIAGKSFPNPPGKSGEWTGHSGYNTTGYYRANRDLGESRARWREGNESELYDDLNTGKQENFNAGGYYGSNYGSVSEMNRGRDYEGNAGYRYNYEHLPDGQWPEIERSARSRGFDLRWRDLAERGVHRGKGPRAYQRSDQRIEEDINDRLTEDPYIDASEIEVTVEKGDVILRGTVGDRNIKRRVEDIAEEVRGVTNVENRLKSASPGGRTVNIKNGLAR